MCDYSSESTSIALSIHPCTLALGRGPAPSASPSLSSTSLTSSLSSIAGAAATGAASYSSSSLSSLSSSLSENYSLLQPQSRR